MDAKRRQQAHHTTRHAQRDLCQGSVFTDCAPRQAVDASGDSFEPACGASLVSVIVGRLCSARSRAQQRPLLASVRTACSRVAADAMLEAVAFTSYLSIKEEEMQRGRRIQSGEGGQFAEAIRFQTESNRCYWSLINDSSAARLRSSAMSSALPAASKARRFLSTPRHLRVVNRAAAALIACCAALIARRA
jgi:hypothetical protein